MSPGTMLWLALVVSLAADAAQPVRKTTVGKPGRIEQVILPGSELEAVPIESREVPVVLRVVATYPHGTAFRYDLEYYALEPGQYDLRNYLKRKDGSPSDDLPPLPVEVASLLPPGQILPNDLAARCAPRLGGYRLLLAVAAVAWIAGLVAILFVGRRARLAKRQLAPRPVTLAERLKPLVTRAVAGQLDSAGQAEMERLLLTYWRRRLHLEETDPVAAVARLREHEEAGLLLRQVEAWLHKPDGAGEVDIQALLAPYRDLPVEPIAAGPEAADLEATHGGGRS